MQAPEGEFIDLSGRLVTAGLINGHHHSHEGFFKGRDDDVLPLELWMRALKPIAAHAPAMFICAP